MNKPTPVACADAVSAASGHEPARGTGATAVRQPNAAHYAATSYNEKKRLASYWHQIDEVLRLGAQRVLEVGPGPGFVTSALREAGVEVITIDFDRDLRPDVCATVTALPVGSATVDVALCCQVLEHIPFDLFRPAIRELRRVARSGLVLSLPDRERCFGLSLFGLTRSYSRRIWDVPRAARRRPTHIDVHHCWEIGAREVDLDLVRDALFAETGVLPRTYRVFEHPWHRFFISRFNEGSTTSEARP